MEAKIAALAQGPSTGHLKPVPTPGLVSYGLGPGTLTITPRAAPLPPPPPGPTVSPAAPPLPLPPAPPSFQDIVPSRPGLGPSIQMAGAPPSTTEKKPALLKLKLGGGAAGVGAKRPREESAALGDEREGGVRVR